MKKNATLLLILTIFMNTEIDANFDDFYDTISASNAYEEEDFNWHSIESYRPEENEYQRFSDACFYNNKNLFNQIFKKHEFWNNLQRLINPQGPTPLLWATLNDNIEMVQTILLHVDFENNYCNQIALYWAIRLEHVEIIDLLLTRIRPLTAQSGYNPIFNNINDINMIKTDYKNMHSSAFSCRSPNILETAIKINKYDLIKKLLESGAKVSEINIHTIRNHQIRMLCSEFLRIQTNIELDRWSEIPDNLPEFIEKYRTDVLSVTIPSIAFIACQILYQTYA